LKRKIARPQAQLLGVEIERVVPEIANGAAAAAEYGLGGPASIILSQLPAWRREISGSGRAGVDPTRSARDGSHPPQISSETIKENVRPVS